jgi:serine/threonine protein kinase
MGRGLTGTHLEQVLAHLDTCGACRIVMAEATRLSPAENGKSRVPRTFAEGERVGDGRYEIRRFIARGGMGEVYEAFDSVLGETLALKTLAVTFVDQADAVRRLFAEVRIARKVMHPNVCRVLELGTHHRTGSNAETIPFLTMPLLTGETLAKRLERTGRLPPREALRILIEVATGLEAIHEVGVVHRDLKSDNIFIVPDDEGKERALVMDFGLARALEAPSAASTSAGILFGTPAYMAPEQVQGKAITNAVDVYALGVIAFELITGRVPFTGESAAVVALARLHRAAVPPSSLVAGLDRRWDVFIRRCMQRRPEDRFARLGDVIAALHRLDSDGRRRSHRGAAALLAAGAAAIAVAWAVMNRPRPNLSVHPEVRTAERSSTENVAAEPARAPAAVPDETAHRTSVQPARVTKRERSRTATARVGAAAAPAELPPNPPPPEGTAAPKRDAAPFKRATRLRARQADDLIDPFRVKTEEQ